MARNVKFSFLRGGGSSLEVLYGKVSLTPTNLHTLSSTAVLPAPTTFDLINGTALATNVAPTPAPVDGSIAWAYKVKITDNFGKSWEYLVGVPDGTTEINFNVLPRYSETRPPAFGVGPAGPAGQSATIAIGTTTSGETPNVTNSGTSTDAVLNFTLQQGPQGIPGVGYTMLADNLSAASLPNTYPEGSSYFRVASSSVMVDWLGYRGFVVTDRKASYAVQTYTGSLGEGTSTRVSNNGTTWSAWTTTASNALATPLMNGLMPAMDKAKLDSIPIPYVPNGTRTFADPPSAYPQGVQVMRGAQADGWPLGPVTAVATFYGGYAGTAFQILKPVYESDPLYIRLAVGGAANTWGDIQEITTGNMANAFAGNFVDTTRYGVVGDGSTDDSVAIQSAVDSAPNRATILFPPGKTMWLNNPIEVNKPLKISGGMFRSATGKGFNVTSTDVHIDGVKISGPGSTAPYVVRNHGIHVEGTEANLLKITISNCEIVGMRDSGIWMEHVRNFTISDNLVNGFRYAGIWVSHGTNGTIYGNIVRDANWEPTSEAYGIAITGGGTNETRSDTVIVSNNIVRNVRDRTGIDTHGGINITFMMNQVHNCKTGITGTVGSDYNATAPQRTVMIGNTIIGNLGYTEGTTVGIAFGGSSDTNPADPLWADILAMSNVIRDVVIPINLPGSQGMKVDRAISLIDHNTSNKPVITIP